MPTTSAGTALGFPKQQLTNTQSKKLRAAWRIESGVQRAVPLQCSLTRLADINPLSHRTGPHCGSDVPCLGNHRIATAMPGRGILTIYGVTPSDLMLLVPMGRRHNWTVSAAPTEFREANAGFRGRRRDHEINRLGMTTKKCIGTWWVEANPLDWWEEGVAKSALGLQRRGGQAAHGTAGSSPAPGATRGEAGSRTQPTDYVDGLFIFRKIRGHPVDHRPST